MLRNDGGRFYILLTNSGDQYGSFNSLRPFSIDFSGKTYLGDVSLNSILVGAGTGASSGDIAIGRTSAPTTAALYFGNAGRYIYFDGTNWNFNPALPSSAAPTTMVSAAPYYCTPTGARGFQASYTNSTSGPVWVTVGLTMPAAFSACYALLNSTGATYLDSATSSASGTMVLFFVVLPGQNYYLSPSGTWPTIAYVLEYK
jgi:hypothetical protein